jgi:DNA-binding NarL/FixJ family response regulator
MVIVLGRRYVRQAMGRRRRASELTIGAVRMIYVSASVDPETGALDRLTPAEQAVARLAAAGLSNAEIGRKRRVSERTIANQLASVFQKLGIGSRVELTQRFS